MNTNIGHEMYSFAAKLFPICRSITGKGVRETLGEIKKLLPGLKFTEVPSNSKCFDWIIPKEWNIKEAYISKLSGEKIIDFRKNNLHIVSYSTPYDGKIKATELKKHLHTLPELPQAIPYVTSYYSEYWGFCLSKEQLDKLDDEEYLVKIDSQLTEGALTYADLIIPGETKQEVLISTYVCHPSMGNNETSGPVLATFLAKFIAQSKRRYTYRFVFVPETIGAVAYISQHLDELKNNVIAGFQLSCVGDNREYSYLPTRRGNTLTDKVMKHVLKHKVKEFKSYSFLNRGSDERQYCSPGVDLPVASIMRSKYGEYKEYHTSLDDMSFISAEGFEGSFNIHVECLNLLEHNEFYKAVHLCEPQLGKRGLRSNSGALGQFTPNFKLVSDILAYSDGESDLIDLAEALNVYALDLKTTIDLLLKHDLVKKK